MPREDDENTRMDELDSLLDALGGPNAAEESDSEESFTSGTHMVDTIDPDAVDFTPFLQNHSGTAVNYHNESHVDTEHHRRLQQNKSAQLGLFDSDTESLESAPRTKHRTPRRYSQQKSPTLWEQLWGTNGSGNAGKSRKSYFAVLDGEEDNMKFIIIGMLAFICFVFFRHQTDAPQPLDGRVVSKASYTPNPDINHAPEETILPQDIEDAYVNIENLPIGIMDTPIYWHIPRSGGTTMKLIMSMCMGRVVACEQGAGHQLDEQLELLNKPFGNFANVDTSTPLGLQRASELGLIPSRMVDVVLTPHVREATKLFDSHHKGRLFALFRDPVDRVVSLYYFLRMPDQEASVGLNVKEMSLAQFASDISENWMVRSLTNTMTGPLDESHLNIAKEILRRKFLIGLLDEKTESLRRIESYFGWKLPSRVSQTCKNNMFYFEPQSKNIHDPIETNSKEYQILVNRNMYDIELYEYAKALFKEQQSLVGGN